MFYPIHGSKFFDIRELVSKQVWDDLGTNSSVLIDPALIAVIDRLRTILASPLIINNWHRGGDFQSSGFRAFYDRTGAKYSQHRCGRAADIKCQLASPESMLKVIKSNELELRSLGLTTIEDLSFTPTWLHLDVRPSSVESGITFVKP